MGAGGVRVQIDNSDLGSGPSILQSSRAREAFGNVFPPQSNPHTPLQRTCRFSAASAKLVCSLAASQAAAGKVAATTTTTALSAAADPPAGIAAAEAAAAAPSIPTLASPPPPAPAPAPPAPLTIIEAFQTLRDAVTCLSELPGLCMEAVPRDSRLPPSAGWYTATSECIIGLAIRVGWGWLVQFEGACAVIGQLNLLKRWRRPTGGTVLHATVQYT